MEFIAIIIVLLIMILLMFDTTVTNKNETMKTVKGGRNGLILRRMLTSNQKDVLNQYTTRIPDSDIHLPPYYDPREQFQGRVGEALDQAACGSCWAFATATSLADRWRIRSNFYLYGHLDYKNSDNTVTKMKDTLSPYYLAGCDFCKMAEHDKELAGILLSTGSCNEQCEGGILQNAMIYAATNGMISMLCNPSYMQYTCHDLKEINGKQVSGRSDGAHCKIYKFRQAYQVNKHEDPKTPEELEENERAIMADIFKHGPVPTGYEIFQNFYDFFSSNPKGIYTTKDGESKGGHAVVLMGWGEENGVKYWLVRNSWGTGWGDKGWFKMLRGQNFCGIESDVWSARPDYGAVIKQGL